MFEKFYPDVYLKSAYDIDFDNLWRRGYRGVIFDIDNTLVEHGKPANERSCKLISNLQALGFKVFFLSNNKEPRVKSFRDGVGYGEYIYKAGKPGVTNYKKAMELMGTTVETTVFVGDQLFTDVWGANKAGIFTFLTAPIDPKEEIQIVLKRILEKPILAMYRRKKKKESGR